MTDKCAEFIVLVSRDGDKIRANRSQQRFVIFGVRMRSRLRLGDKEPGCTLEKAGISLIDAAELFARHGMSRQKPRRRLLPEDRVRARDDLGFSAADISKQDVSRKSW